MGALATFAPWTPEDDLLLKNAVEAGASLESLAKGAVQFSRRYSVREIQDRWYSLLYDPIISAEAAAAMTNYELSVSPLPAKFVKFGNSRERKIVSAKRKAESVRACYYAMRKRACNDALTPMDFSFLVDPEDGDYVENEHCLPEGATSNHLSNLDLPHDGFLENMMDGDVVNNGVTANTMMFPENILKEETQILGDNVSSNGAVEELGVPEGLEIGNLIGDDNLEKMPLSSFDHINNDPGNLCSEFDEDHLFDSPELECGTSFNNLQLSPLPELPMWRTDESIQEPDIQRDGLKDSVACGEAYLEELSNSLFNFTNEEELFLMDVDGKDGIDKSYYDGLSSLLLNSPIDGSTDQIPERVETESSVALHAHVTNQSTSCCAVVADDNPGSQSSGVQVVHKLESQMPSSASAKDPQFPELVNGVICCVLNTEDPEVPSNDDVFLPFDAPPSTFSCLSKPTSKESNKPILSPVQDYGYRANERGKILMQVDRKNSIESRASSQIKCELPNGQVSLTMSRSSVISSSGLGGNNNAAKTTNAQMHANPKEEPTSIGLAKHPSNHMTNSIIEKPALVSNDFRNHLHPNGSGMKQEQDVALPSEDHHLQCAEVGSSDALESEPVISPPTLDEEEQYIESDGDVPYYSDIEAMVLDMDLDPDDQDLYYNEEVLKYQLEETKRTIMRLEQGAHSHMQRAIASHGAFAVLYGRHSKHYIKKTEVLLGRATDGVPVDIDLGKEGYAKTISRRQAVIKMDKDGSFYIKNFGKSSILVNNKEVHTGQSHRLHSNYLIELRGMPFIFETNQSRVKQYLDHINDN